LRPASIGAGTDCYIASLSSRTVVYKGMLRAEQLGGFFPDLLDTAMVSGLALVHSRFSTTRFHRGRWRIRID